MAVIDEDSLDDATRFLVNKVCKCKCHVDGRKVMHISKCCSVAGKYIESDGTIDVERYLSLEESNGKPKEPS